MSAPIVVIGGGLAGWTTVREFRKLDTGTPVVVVTSDSGDFYAKPSLSNAFAQKRLPAQLISTPAAKMAETLNVTLMAHTQVTGIDIGGKGLTLQNGEATTTLSFSQLVLATGAKAIRAPMAGDAVDQVRAVNSLDDFAAFHASLHASDADNDETGSKTIVLIGAGLIGCEFANDLLQAGHSVHVVDPSSRPLAALLPEAAGLELQKALEDLGTKWHFGSTVQTVDSAGASGLCITLSDATILSADAVLSAIGLRADTALAAAAGLACERGVVVDAQLRTSAPHVFALGDCAQYASAGQRTLPYVMPIMNAAKALAANLAGTPTALVFPLMPVSIKTPAWPIVVSAAHPSVAGEWIADANEASGVWRFIDSDGVQRGFVLTAKQTVRRMEFSKTTVL